MEEDWNQFPVYEKPQPEEDWSQFKPVQEQRAAPAEDWSQFRAVEQPAPEPAPESQLGAGIRSFAHAIPGTLGGIAGGALAGGAAGTLGAGPIGTIGGAIIGGIAGGFAGEKVKETGLDLIGFDDSHQLAVNAAEHPWTTAGASAGAMVLGGGASGASRLARGIGAGVGGGLETGRELAMGEDLSPSKIATTAAGGALFARPYEYVNKLTAKGGQLAERWRPPSSNSNPGPTASGGVAEDMIPPAKTTEPDIGNPQSRPVGSEIEYTKDILSPEGDNAGVTVRAANDPVDVTTRAALDAEITPIDPNAPTQFGPKLDAEFPRAANVQETPPVAPQAEAPQPGPGAQPPPVAAAVPEPAGRAGRPPPEVAEPAARPVEQAAPAGEEGIPGFLKRGPDNRVPDIEPPAPLTPREAIAQRAPGQTVGDILQRDVLERGPSGRPIRTGRLPIGSEQAILEAGAAKATGPKLEPREPETLAARRKAAPAPGEGPIAQAGDAAEAARFEMDRPLANKIINQPRVRLNEAKTRGVAPEELLARAREVLKGPVTEAPPKLIPEPEGAPAVLPADVEAPAALRGKPSIVKPTGGEGGKPPPPEGPLIKPIEGGGGEGGGGGKRISPAEPKTALSIAERFNDTMYRHNTEASARTVNYENRIKDSQKIYPINDKTDTALYNAKEAGEFNQLPAKQQEAYNKTIADLNKERVEAFKELVKRKGLSEEEQVALADFGEENYQHRIRKMSRADEEYSAADPVTGYVGSRTPGAMKALTFKEGIAADGSRVVVSHPGEGKYTIWENGKTRTVAGPEEFKNGQSFDADGKKFTIDRGLTKNIEQHARDENGKPLEYFKSGYLSAVEAHQQVVTRLEFLKMMDDFKVNTALDGVRMRAGENAPKDWKESRVPELKGFVMDPYMRAAIDNNYRPGLGIDVPKIVQDFNRFATKSIFWNPVPHAMNAQVHHIVARGEDWFTTNPQTWKNFGKSIFEAYDAVINRTPELERLLKAGAPMVMSGIDRQNAMVNIGKMTQQDFRAHPRQWEELARSFNLGKPIDAIRYVYDGAQRILWSYSDILMASRIRELEMRGMSTEAAIKDAGIHMPDYRVPIQMFNSTFLPKLMADNNVMMFGRYHMGMMKSLTHMAADALGPNATTEERRKAFGNIAALGVMGFMVKPALDYLVQTVTGNKEAKMHPRGPLGPITGAYEALGTGERSVGSVLSNLNTINPSLKYALDILNNRDFAGRQIIEPKAPTYKKAAQLADYTAGAAVSPYATFGPTIQPGTSRPGPLSTLGQQLFDVKVPTEAQSRGKRYGEKQNVKSARQREKKPRGLIEYMTP